MSATEARARWFRLLDEIVAGEVVVLERKGRKVVLRCEEPSGEDAAAKMLPDYRRLIRAPDAARADEWGWKWDGKLTPGRAATAKKPR